MMQLLTAAFMYLLAAARLPAFIRTRRDAVFIAALLAGTAGLLTSPDVYVAADSALGGRNIATLVQHSLMVTAIWNIRSGIMAAISHGTDRGVRRYGLLPLYVTLAMQAVFFVLTVAGRTTTDFGNDYNGTLPGAVFYSMVMLFTGWVCAEIAAISRRFVPRMRGPFKAGFLLVSVGAFLGAFAAAAMVLDILAASVPTLSFFSFHQTPLQEIFELVPTALIGIGLTIPAVAGQLDRAKSRRREKATLAAVAPIRDRALALADTGRTLPSDPGTTVSEQLHRTIVQIWDAELASGSASAITDEERAYLLAVEKLLDLERATGDQL